MNDKVWSSAKQAWVSRVWIEPGPISCRRGCGRDYVELCSVCACCSIDCDCETQAEAEAEEAVL